MLSLDKVVAGANVRGLAGTVPVEVVRTEWIGSDALNVVYRGADGPSEVLLFRDAEPRLELIQATRAFSFDGDSETFRIASEAQRIRLAHLFDPYLAVHSSRIDALPHPGSAAIVDDARRKGQARIARPRVSVAGTSRGRALNKPPPTTIGFPSPPVTPPVGFSLPGAGATKPRMVFSAGK
jgi:hypothetical protein